MSRVHSVVSLFTGAGGLDLGLEAAGFGVQLCVEVDPVARTTLARNRPQWELAKPGDIHRLSAKALREQAGVGRGQVTLLAGGPPCQPWSRSAAWAKQGAGPGRLDDPRAKTLTAYGKVVDEILPEVLLLENVSGLTSKKDGLDALRRRIDRVNKRQGTRYEFSVVKLNSVDYGAPQSRERVIVVAHRDGKEFRAPAPTHGTGRAEPYRTAWDAIGHLDDPTWPNELKPTGKWGGLLPSIPEGHNYLWHTERKGGEPLFGWRTRYWSFLLKLAKRLPSWTIQAAPGPATGPFHWRSRRLSVAELAALQTFPADYVFEGTRRDAQRQIGNAVPCVLGEVLGREIRRQLLEETPDAAALRFEPSRRDDCPRATRQRPVPPSYLPLRGEHAPHPGHGLGPGVA